MNYLYPTYLQEPVDKLVAKLEELPDDYDVIVRFLTERGHEVLQRSTSAWNYNVVTTRYAYFDEHSVTLRCLVVVDHNYLFELETDVGGDGPLDALRRAIEHLKKGYVKVTGNLYDPRYAKAWKERMALLDED